MTEPSPAQFGSLTTSLRPIPVSCHQDQQQHMLPSVKTFDLNLCFTDWYCYYDRENYSFEAFHISFFVSSFALPVIFNTILNVINVHHNSADIYKSCSKSIHMIDPILAWKHSDDSSIDQLMTSRKDSGLSID